MPVDITFNRIANNFLLLHPKKTYYGTFLLQTKETEKLSVYYRLKYSRVEGS